MAYSVTTAEWKLMELLWDKPHTLMELVHELEVSQGWAKSTIKTMVRRLETKGVIAYETNGRTKTFYPVLLREEVAAQQAESLLCRAYHGSVGLFVNAMVQRNSLSQEQIHELYEILRKAEEELE